MNSGINVDNPLITAAFRSALLHQWIIAMVIFGALGLAWITLRAWLPATAQASVRAEASGPPGQAVPEPAWRRLLRLGFGVLWVFDGILQAQPKMALGLPSQVVRPIAASSPTWVQHLVNWGGTTWSYHPMQAGASAVWIQIGIGGWLLAASRGPSSRLAGLASAAWGLVVWVFGEAFGGIFAPGLTWLFGAPGAVLLYSVAGALIALPERTWHSPRLGRMLLAGIGVFLVGMAVLQAWPGRGFWQGTIHGGPVTMPGMTVHGGPGTLAGMTASMAQTPQPRLLSVWIQAFTGFDEAHGFAVNLFAVTVLAVIGGIFLTGRARLIRPAIAAFTVLCLADWVLVEDCGFFGGLGTDPNSMIPFALLAIAGYLALTPKAMSAAAPAAAAVPAAGWRERLRLTSLRDASFRSVATLGAVGMIILGAAPMAAAQANRNADPILAQAIAGPAARLNLPTKGFQLTDQHGRTVTLASLRGKVVLLTFLDPVCTTDCRVIAQELRAAGQLLRAAAPKVELVAIVANPVYHQIAATQAFDRQEHLSQVPNWLYLTGTLPQLRHVWAEYGITARILPAGSMIRHSDMAYVIDENGHVRAELNANPGPGTSSTKSSFAVLLANTARQYLGPS